MNKHPEMNGNINALIEFVRTESAHNAINKNDWTEGEYRPEFRGSIPGGVKVISISPGSVPGVWSVFSFLNQVKALY